jgi:hypothetical protein
LGFKLVWYPCDSNLAFWTRKVTVPWRWHLENVFSFKGVQDDVFVIFTVSHLEAAWACYLAHADAAHFGIILCGCVGWDGFGLWFVCYAMSDIFKQGCRFQELFAWL